MVVNLKEEKLKSVLNLDKKIAVRVPNNQCILSILKECKMIIGTSANLSGTQSFTNPDECIKQITGYDLFVDGGVIQSKGESTVVEIDKELKILRQGVISKNEIMDLFHDSWFNPFTTVRTTRKRDFNWPEASPYHLEMDEFLNLPLISASHHATNEEIDAWVEKHPVNI